MVSLSSESACDGVQRCKSATALPCNKQLLRHKQALCLRRPSRSCGLRKVNQVRPLNGACNSMQAGISCCLWGCRQHSCRGGSLGNTGCSTQERHLSCPHGVPSATPSAGAPTSGQSPGLRTAIKWWQSGGAACGSVLPHQGSRRPQCFGTTTAFHCGGREAWLSSAEQQGGHTRNARGIPNWIRQQVRTWPPSSLAPRQVPDGPWGGGTSAHLASRSSRGAARHAQWSSHKRWSLLFRPPVTCAWPCVPQKRPGPPRDHPCWSCRSVACCCMNNEARKSQEAAE